MSEPRRSCVHRAVACPEFTLISKQAQAAGQKLFRSCQARTKQLWSDVVAQISAELLEVGEHRGLGAAERVGGEDLGVEDGARLFGHNLAPIRDRRQHAASVTRVAPT